MLNKPKRDEGKKDFLGFRYERDKAKRFRRAAKREGGISKVLARLADEYLRAVAA